MAKTILEKRMKIWEACLSKGWERLAQPAGMNCLYEQSEDGSRLRLNFKDKELTLEKKQTVPEELKEQFPNKTNIWIEVETSSYRRVEIKEEGLEFNTQKTTTTKKARAASTKGDNTCS